MSEELKACPYCGGKVHRIGGDNEDVSHDIECTKCAYIFYDLSTGNGWWNSRPLEDALLEENKRLKEIVNSFTSGFSLNIFGVLPNGNEACGRDEGMVRGCEFLSELYDKSLPFIEKNSPSAQEALK